MDMEEDSHQAGVVGEEGKEGLRERGSKEGMESDERESSKEEPGGREEVEEGLQEGGSKEGMESADRESSKGEPGESGGGGDSSIAFTYRREQERGSS